MSSVTSRLKHMFILNLLQIADTLMQFAHNSIGKPNQYIAELYVETLYSDWQCVRIWGYSKSQAHITA
jgi:hypothetical protein